MAERNIGAIQSENKSIIAKSRAFKIGIGMVVVGSLFYFPAAALGLGVAAGSAAWHSKKNIFGGKKNSG